jgi:hypothetical protein
MKIRITRPIISHLEGTHAWQCPDDTDYSDPLEIGLMDKVKTATARKDGSVTVDLNADECAVLAEYVEVQAIGAKDNIVPPRDLRLWPDLAQMNTVGEYNACQALLRQISRAIA